MVMSRRPRVLTLLTGVLTLARRRHGFKCQPHSSSAFCGRSIAGFHRQETIMSNPTPTGTGTVLKQSVPTNARPTTAGRAGGKSDLADARVPGLVVAVGFLVLAFSFMVNAMDRQVF